MGHAYELCREQIEGMDDMGAVCDRVTSKPAPKVEAAADVLGRLADQAQRIYDAAYKLCPDNEAPFTSGTEQHTYTTVFDCMERAVAALRVLQGIEEARGDERNDSPGVGHYPHVKPAVRMVVAA